jgi:hypothetical protein
VDKRAAEPLSPSSTRSYSRNLLSLASRHRTTRTRARNVHISTKHLGGVNGCRTGTGVCACVSLVFLSFSGERGASHCSGGIGRDEGTFDAVRTAVDMSNISEVLSIGVSEGVSGYSAWVSDDPNGTDPGTPCDPAHPPHYGECRWKCDGKEHCDSSGDNDCGCCVSDPSVAECTLLGGTEQNLVQAFCALTGFCSLVLKKRFLDDKKGGVQRGWKVWGMDVTKQGTSGVAAHVAGIVNSYLLNDADDGGNACSWYFISFTFDTTLGVIIGYILLHLLQEASKKAEWSSLQATGNYKRTSTTMSAAGQGCVEKDWCPTGVDGMVWFKQMISWCLITLVARAFVGCVLFLNRSWLVHIARVVAEPFTCEPTVLLVLVMLGCPLCLNALQLVRATPPPPPSRLLYLLCGRCPLVRV